MASQRPSHCHQVGLLLLLASCIRVSKKGSWSQVRQEWGCPVWPPQSLGPRLSHTSAQKGTGANSGGRSSLVAGSREPPTFKRSCCPESRTSQLMRAQTPVHNHQKGGKIEAQCLGTRRVILVSFLVEGAGARFSKPTRKKTEKTGLSRQLAQRDRTFRKPTAPGSQGPARWFTSPAGEEGTGPPARADWLKGQGRLALSGDTRGKPRLRTQAHAGSGDRGPELSPSAEWWRGREGGRAPRGPKAPPAKGGRTRAISQHSGAGRKTRTARSRKGRGRPRAGRSPPPGWTPDPGFYQSLVRPGPLRLLPAVESRALGEGR